MGLSCSCNDYDGDGWWYMGPEEYTNLATKRRRRCCSCHAPINVGDLCVRFPRYFDPGEDSIKWKIWGEGAPLASWYMCEKCGDQYFNLTALGFCITLGADTMDELRREYVAMRESQRKEQHGH